MVHWKSNSQVVHAVAASPTGKRKTRLCAAAAFVWGHSAGHTRVYCRASSDFHPMIPQRTHTHTHTHTHTTGLRPRRLRARAGPFKRVGVALSYATNPSVLFDKDSGRYLLFIIPTGNRKKGPYNCTHRDRAPGAGEAAGGWPALAPPPPPAPVPLNHTQIFSAAQLTGPWTPEEQHFPLCNNPSPAVHPNGTKYVGAVWVWGLSSRGGRVLYAK